MTKVTRNFLQAISSLVCLTQGLQLLLHMDPSTENLDVLIGEKGFLVMMGGGLDDCGVGVGVASLLDKLKSLEDGILMGSIGFRDSHPTLIFLFFGNNEGMIG